MTEKMRMAAFFKLEEKGKSNTQCISSAKNNTFYRKSIWYFHCEIYLSCHGDQLGLCFCLVFLICPLQDRTVLLKQLAYIGRFPCQTIFHGRFYRNFFLKCNIFHMSKVLKVYIFFFRDNGVHVIDEHLSKKQTSFC